MNKVIFLVLISLALSKNLRILTINSNFVVGKDKLYERQNEIRASHGVPAFAVDPDVEKHAQKFAEDAAKRGVLEHSDLDLNGERLGENIYLIMLTGGDGMPDFTGTDAIDYWYKEHTQYDYSKPGWSETTGHFTQIVWKSSTKVGCGVASGIYNTYNALWVVCDYLPAGNVVINNDATKSFKENVLPIAKRR